MTVHPSHQQASFLDNLRELTRRLIGAESKHPDRPSVREMAKTIQEVLKTGDIKVPIFPAAAQHTTELIGDPNARISEIASLIETDAALCAELLRVANSAAFSGGTEIRTVQRAVAQLGLNRLRSMLFVVVRNAMFPRRTYKDLHARYFQQSLAVACACEALEPILGISIEGSFLFGILHNIGCAGLLNIITELQHSEELPRDLTVEEVEHLVSLTYEPCGAIIARKWHLPLDFQHAIRYHNTPERLTNSGDRAPALLTHLAIELCASYHIGDFPPHLSNIHHSPHIQKLDLDPDALNRAAAKTKVHFADLRSCF
ncbi:MAG: HDOD domain-containing protein [Myxococcota bacterium]